MLMVGGKGIERNRNNDAEGWNLMAQYMHESWRFWQAKNRNGIRE
jgi:hypothetical protein